MDTCKVRITASGEARIPRYSSEQAAGADICACLPDGSITLRPGERTIVGTGLRIELPLGYEAQIRPRSGLAAKHGITVLNSPGTVDSDYRGEICVILINLSDEDFVINDGDRIAQMVIAKHERALFVASDELDDTKRGGNGFGSTGISG